MSEVKRLSLDMQFAKSQVKHDDNGELCFYRDYAALQQSADEYASKYMAAQDNLKKAHLLYQSAIDERGALQQKLDAVLAENAEIKSGIADITFMRDDDFFSSTQEAQRVMGFLVNIKTPATDAILNEVRAEGASMVSTRILACLDEFPGRVADIVQECANIADSTASELRAGNTEGANHD